MGNLTQEQKRGISSVANEYCKNHGISGNELMRISGCSYASYILKGEFSYPHPKTKDPREISDQYFEKLASAIGYKVTKEYWPTVFTDQYKAISVFLTDAKRKSEPCTLIGESGCGKSYSISDFRKRNPNGTYITICNDLFTSSDLLDAIMDSMKIPEHEQPKNPAKKLRLIKIFLSKRAAEGLKPMLILDEAENMKLSPLKSIKALYDALIGTCSITLIGTEELKRKMDKLRYRTNGSADGIPQFYRRFMVAYCHELNTIDQTFSDFLRNNPFVKDNRISKKLVQICHDYGSLHDYLEPTIREAEEMGVELTYEFFSAKYKL